ncbi:MAG: DUF445 family protein [Planctomycetia bacterium]|nr:DUF445 family protein [Planctomycetia bacterium]
MNSDNKEIISLGSGNKYAKWISQTLERLCFYVSWGTIGLFFIQIFCNYRGILLPGWVTSLMVILLAAAVGYITNFIAIEMLFKPYEKSYKHYLTIASFGIWSQGLIPSNKNKIAQELGKQIKEHLLDESKIAGEICDTVSKYIENKDNINQLQTGIQNLLREHESRIVDFIYPQVEESLYLCLDNLMTKENFEKITNERIIPYLKKENVRQYLAQTFTGMIRGRSEDLILLLKKLIKDFIYDFLSKKPLTSPFAKSISDGIVQGIHWNTIEWQLYDLMKSNSFQKIIADEIPKLLDKIRTELQSPDSQRKLPVFLDSVKMELKDWLTKYIRETMPLMVKNAIESETLWNWAKTELVTTVKPKLELWLQTRGKDLVVQKLDVSNRVREAIDKQNVKKFHDMVNAVARENLSMIQLLGYVLGGVIGVLQVVSSLLATH